MQKGRKRIRTISRGQADIQGYLVKYRIERVETDIIKKAVAVDFVFNNLPIEYEDFPKVEKDLSRLCKYTPGIVAVDCSGGGKVKRKCTISITTWEFNASDEQLVLSKVMQYFKSYVPKEMNKGI